MMGLIKKDLLMIKNNYKAIVIALLLSFIYTTQFGYDMSFFLPFMGFTICLSTISYDDFNNWHLYAASLPQGKSGVVKSKYITTICVVTILCFVSFIMSLVIGSYNGDLVMDDLLSNIFGVLLALYAVVSFLYPLIFKFGSEKGRIALMAIGFGVFALVLLFTKFIHIDIPVELIKFFDSYFIITFIITSVVMISISYLISKKIYLKKEF